MIGEHPLGLPKGSIRAILILMIAGASVLAAFIRPEANELLGAPLLAGLAFYFGGRSNYGNNHEE